LINGIGSESNGKSHKQQKKERENAMGSFWHSFSPFVSYSIYHGGPFDKITKKETRIFLSEFPLHLQKKCGIVGEEVEERRDNSMDMLRKFFPFAFKEKKDIVALVIHIILHIVADAVLGVVIGLIAWIPIIGWIIGALSGLIGLYIFISLVLCILDYLKILK
jgi:uncharacterized membrane protein